MNSGEIDECKNERMNGRALWKPCNRNQLLIIMDIFSPAAAILYFPFVVLYSEAITISSERSRAHIHHG